jgi:hypothetical protein
MSDKKKASTDNETILMALDQISQTIDVMTSVVGRLRTYVHERETGLAEQGAPTASRSKVEANKTLH